MRACVCPGVRHDQDLREREGREERRRRLAVCAMKMAPGPDQLQRQEPAPEAGAKLAVSVNPFSPPLPGSTGTNSSSTNPFSGGGHLLEAEAAGAPAAVPEELAGQEAALPILNNAALVDSKQVTIPRSLSLSLLFSLVGWRWLVDCLPSVGGSFSRCY